MILDLIRQSRMRPLTMGGSMSGLDSNASFGREIRTAVRTGSAPEAKENVQESQTSSGGSWTSLTSWLKSTKE